MKQRILAKLRLYSLVCIISFLPIFGFSQNTNDSLSLNQIISQIIQNHPSIKQAEEALNIADAKISFAKAGYLPNVDVSGTYTRIGPVPEFDMGTIINGMSHVFVTQTGVDLSKIGGKMQMASPNNLSAGINVSENIYDFGKTANDVAAEKESKNLSIQSIELVKQKMATSAITCYYSLVYLQEAIEIKTDELKVLNSHLEFVQKKQETGSATQYEIISTQVRISVIESQKIDLETGRQLQLSIMNSLLGQAGTTKFNVKKELTIASPNVPIDSLLSYAFAHRDEIKLAHEKETIANLKYKFVKSQNNPSLNLFASGGFKNGYLPNLDKQTANYAAGISLRVPLFDANRTKSNALVAKSNIQNTAYETDLAQRNVNNEVIDAKINFNAAQRKEKQFEMQLKQAAYALSLAEVNFKNGAITNLDLLDASRMVSDSKLLLLKSKIDCLSSTYKLKAAIGDRLY